MLSTPKYKDEESPRTRCNNSNQSTHPENQPNTPIHKLFCQYKMQGKLVVLGLVVYCLQALGAPSPEGKDGAKGALPTC